ncbi:MAG: hypothetical protein EOO16_12110 [Chitinophagaceae bacterium]|nr:MAG: hypothetical protein EOO16_12110 [Chitinophagaceae bacterium]
MLRTLLLLLLFGGRAAAQDLSGLYTGSLYNDTTRMTQQYELAITHEGDKVRGHAYTTFTLDDKFYFGFREVKGRVKDGKLFIEESDLIENNFPSPPPKGIRRLSVFPIAGEGRTLEGRWETQRTRKWRPVTGSISLRKKGDSTSSALVARMREARIIPPVVTEAPASAPAAVPVAKTPVKQTPPPARVLTFAERSIYTVQTISVAADSVSIALYDNGLVDGDSVSVVLDGEPVVQHVKLTEQAFRRTIMLPVSNTDHELVLMAENLGSLPPNTGLLVISAGGERYNVYFSADLQTNARIIIKRQR